MHKRLLLLAWLVLLIGIPADGLAVSLQFTKVSTLTSVTDIGHAGDGSSRLFLTEQSGRVRILKTGVLLPQSFLDIKSRVKAGGEQGLLSTAFAPDYAESGFFYVWYTDNNSDMVLSRFAVSANPDLANANSEQIILKITQTKSNHNGGRLVFGPDGYLYLSVGDGGGAGDPDENGQKLNLYGTILRLDVNPVNGTYAVPNDNPFVGKTGADEIWAYGLRNPWRISFDRLTGDLYIADVGQGKIEEINFQAALEGGGQNYGWNILEGSECFDDPMCDPDGSKLPVAEYTHVLGCSVTGGEVYRGNAYPDLRGMYLYGDFCSGRIWGLKRAGEGWVNSQLANTPHNIMTFGQDENGRVFLSSQGDGVYLISDGPPLPEPPLTINPGMNDAWFNAQKGGQGVLVSVYPVIGKVFMAWFTWDVERPDESVVAILEDPGMRWLSGLGNIDGHRVTMGAILTSGGEFDAGNPGPEEEAYGTIVLVFTGCNQASLTYNFPGAGVSGQVLLRRVAKDNIALCEALSAAP